MGLLDGAVNGMATRLIPAGFTPYEAFCLGQAAYIKEGKRDSSVPSAELSRRDATAAINQALEILGQFPMGVEAHRQRIRLWEHIFGFGSWHEPVDPEEIYSPLELLARGYQVPRSSGGTAVPHGTSEVTVQAAVERVFQVVVGSSQDGEFINQMSEASDKAEPALKQEVESAGYVWVEQDAEYWIFTVGDTDLPAGIPEGALDRYFPGTVCAMGIITARRPS